MAFGAITLFLAILLAGWSLVRMARQNRVEGGAAPDGQGRRNDILFRAILWLAISASLFAVKLWPLALMVLLAAAFVSGIEFWKQETINRLEHGDPSNKRAGGQGRDDAQGGLMTHKEARAVLGLKADASPEMIRSAHRRLIQQMHPDSGGSTFLAAKINDARDVLLKNRAVQQKKSSDT